MCSLLGGLIIITGLYLVVWGKSRERKVDVVGENMKDFSTYGTSMVDSTETGKDLREPLLLVDGRSSNETLNLSMEGLLMKP